MVTSPLDEWARMVRSDLGSVLTPTSGSPLSAEASIAKADPSAGSTTVTAPDDVSASTVVGDWRNSRLTPELVELATTSALRPPVTLMPPPEVESCSGPIGSPMVMSPPDEWSVSAPVTPVMVMLPPELLPL